MSDLKKEIKRLSNLVQNRGKDKIHLEQQAQMNVWKKQTNLDSRFSKKEDIELANSLFDTYIENYTVESYNDVQNIVDLIYEEVIQQKIQKDIDKILSDDDSKFIPDKQITSLHSIQQRIWELKERIGISKKDKTHDDLTAMQELEKQFDIHIAHNRNEFTLYAPYKCSTCGQRDVQSLLLRRKVKDFNVLKHPFFSGRFWYNRRGIELVKNGIWTKEQYAFVFFTSVAYVDWVIENEPKIIEIENVNSEDINEFINNTDYLKKIDVPLNILKVKKEINNEQK